MHQNLNANEKRGMDQSVEGVYKKKTEENEDKFDKNAKRNKKQ